MPLSPPWRPAPRSYALAEHIPSVQLHPISLHKLRAGSEYLPLWKMLEVRDAANERALNEWRQQHRANAAPVAKIKDLLAARG